MVFGKIDPIDYLIFEDVTSDREKDDWDDNDNCENDDNEDF